VGTPNPIKKIQIGCCCSGRVGGGDYASLPEMPTA
jgi:hypothetical protein